MEQSLLDRIRSYNFAVYDMLLYLDTHPDDKAAFEMFRDLTNKTKALKAEYEKEAGPLSAFSAGTQADFNWLSSPWPWEKEAN